MKIQFTIMFMYLCVFRPQFHAVTKDMLVRRHVMPSTSTPVGSRMQPVLAMNRGATFSGYDSKLHSSGRDPVIVADIVNSCQSSDNSRRKHSCDGTTENCSTIQFSPDKQQCSTPAGHARCVPATTSSFVVRRELTADASFCNKSHCSTRVSRHASINCSEDRPRKPEKLSSSFLSGGGLGFLRKLSTGSAHSVSPNHTCVADVSTTSVRRRSSIRDSFKRIFLNRRFGCDIVVELFCALICYCQVSS